jgi:hypothetical protein
MIELPPQPGRRFSKIESVPGGTPVRKLLLLGLFASPALFAADPLAQIYDNQVSSIERDVLRLAHAIRLASK